MLTVPKAARQSEVELNRGAFVLLPGNPHIILAILRYVRLQMLWDRGSGSGGRSGPCSTLPCLSEIEAKLTLLAREPWYCITASAAADGKMAD
jgi:hypothetical protein